jgi:coenzyme F420-reducing hydrogenase alpha subunit
MTTLNVEHVARIEGHGDITIQIEGGKVSEVRLDVTEPARFFETMVRGRRYEDAPLITSRICGICSPNHALTSIKAIEAALGVEVSERTRVMRKLLLFGSYLQNHATHLYFLAAPDYVGTQSVLPLADSHPQVVARALSLKKLGNELTTTVGGRSIHPVTAVVGGFTSEPSPRDLAGLRARLAAAIDDAVVTAELFASFTVPSFSTEGDMLALSAPDDYAIYEGAITSLLGGWTLPEADYGAAFHEKIIEHSNAKHSVTRDDRTFMVGALPRLTLNHDLLGPAAQRAMDKVWFDPATRNPFLNNVAQAIELVDATERCIDYIDRLADIGGDCVPASVAPAAGSGAAATEAPRGTLYHAVTLTEDGSVTGYDVVTPTAQNLANLEADMWGFAPHVTAMARDEAQLAIERLVRAYDPCLSCSVH